MQPHINIKKQKTVILNTYSERTPFIKSLGADLYRWVLFFDTSQFRQVSKVKELSEEKKKVSGERKQRWRKQQSVAAFWQGFTKTNGPERDGTELYFNSPNDSEYTKRENVNGQRGEQSTQHDRKAVSDSVFFFFYVSRWGERRPWTPRTSQEHPVLFLLPASFLRSIIHPSPAPHYGRHAS